FSRLGLMFQSGYEHSVRELHEFPTQNWVAWETSLEGEVVAPFASTNDPVYQRMLAIIEEARTQQLLKPRVDMPFANEIGAGIVAGRSRQIIPQPLPDPLPKIDISVDDDGIVRLRWERSRRTIGLIAEVSRISPSNNSWRLIGRTELAEFIDTSAPSETVCYEVVFVSDPAETCGTTKSGAVLMFEGLQQVNIPQVGRMEFRCPLSTAEPTRSISLFRVVRVPPPTPPPAPKNLRAESRPGAVRLLWNEDRPGQYRYNVYAGERKLNDEPVLARSFGIGTNVLEDVEYTVETVSRVVGGRSTVSAQPLPMRTDPVFVLSPDAGRLVAPATFDANSDSSELNLSTGGHFVVEPNEEFNVGEAFSIEFSVKLDSNGGMPIIVGHGYWNQAGWFVQSIGGRWRFHVGGVDCDGGSPKVGEWMHILGTYDGSTLRLYENGTLVAERHAIVNKNPWTRNLVIGQYSGQLGPDFQVRGRIKDVRIWHRVLVE
ncbi:MAG: LamG domain-containing protein, partial [Planctomycetaceae bacterium]|nr:LamG domain-containing protein [Planctomycetaceae bacterium]